MAEPNPTEQHVNDGDPQPDNYIVDTWLGEYLAISAGQRDGQIVAVISLREPNCFREPLNIAIPKKGARRLCRDLRRLFKTKGSWLND